MTSLFASIFDDRAIYVSLITTREFGVVMLRSRLSVCLCVSVCTSRVLIFEFFDLQTAFSVRTYIFGIPRLRSSIKAIGSRSRPQEQNDETSVTKRVVCLRLKANLVL